MKKPKLPQIRIPLDFDDIFIITGTAFFVYGLWGYDPRMAFMVLGGWLVYLGRPRPKGGGE